MGLLAGPVDPAGLVQINDTICHHLGMHAKILGRAVQKFGADGVWHAADADLQAGAVLDARGDQAAHRAVHVAGRWVGQDRRRLVVALDDEIHLADMHGIVHAGAMGQAVGYLDDHAARAFDGGAVPQVRGAEVEVAVGIHPAGPQHQHAHRLDEPAVVIGNFPQVHGQVAHAAGIVLAAVIAREMQAQAIEMLSLRVFFEHGAGAGRQAGADLDVPQLVAACGQGLVEFIGLAQHGTIVDPHPRLHKLRRFGRCDLTGRMCGTALEHR